MEYNLAKELPLDMWRNILVRLPAECLFRLKAVCKQWCKVIDDPNFAKAHNHSSSSSSHTLLIIRTLGCGTLHTFDLNAAVRSDQSITGSSLEETSPVLRRLPFSECNGLLLVPILDAKKTPSFEIWNLSTHEQLQLPPRLVGPHSSLGLGYDHAAQDVKAVARQGQQTHVYSLRSDTWRKIGDCPCIARGVGAFLRGALHWLSSDSDKIVALHLGTEKHRLIQLLPGQKRIHNKNIDVLSGCFLVLSYYSSYSSDHDFEVWVMKDYGSGDHDESWTKWFSIKKKDLPSFSVRPVAYIKDKNQVFLKDGMSGFLVFDVESNCIKKRVRIHGLPNCLDAQVIPRSIFRLRDHCGDSGITRIQPLNRPMKINKEVSNS